MSHIVKIINSVTPLPKLCKDCKYLKKGIFSDYTFAECTKIYTIDLIAGSRKYDYASIAREYDCKEKYFEEKIISGLEKYINSMFK